MPSQWATEEEIYVCQVQAEWWMGKTFIVCREILDSILSIIILHFF
jgi:hypothetical protein